MRKQQSLNYKIADEHIYRNNFLFYCRNCLIDLINYVDEHHLSSEKINYKSDADEKRALAEYQKDKSQYEKWLLNNGYKDVVYNFYYKHLLFSLIVDFSNYYTASIENAYNGNINVAWALLRKPLQETLAYIEWLYVDKNDLLNLMIEQEDVTKYEIKNVKGKIKNYIQTIQTIDEANVIDMFKFRYSYKDEYSLNGIMQATNHLITTKPALKTSPSGLNYVFADDEITNRNIGFYYTSIPYVMFYTMNIIMEMFNDIADFNDLTKLMNKLNLTLKNFEAIPISYQKAKSLIIKDSPLFCPNCGKKYETDRAWIKFTNNKFLCKKCLNRLNTYGYIFEYEKVTLSNNN